MSCKHKALWLVASAAIGVACGGENLLLPIGGAAYSIRILAGNEQTGRVGTALPESLLIQITDSTGRPVAGQTIVFEAPSSDGDVSPDTVITNRSGQAAARWVLGTRAGAQRVRAQLRGPAISSEVFIDFAATASPGPATTLAQVSGNHQTAPPGSLLPDSLVVRATDQYGNPVEGVRVGWTVSGGGSLSSASAPTGPLGFSIVRWVLGPGAGAQSATATAAGLSGSPSVFQAVATAGASGKLSVAIQPSRTAQSGVPLAQLPAIQLRDAAGNPLGRSGVAITVVIASGPSGATLSGSTTAATDLTGVVTFNGLGLNGPSGDYTLNFTAAGFTGVTSDAITIAAGNPTTLALLVQPSSSAQSGQLFARQPRVQVQDAAGNAVGRAGIPVTVSIASGSGTLAGTTTRTTDTNGIASFTDLVITGPSGTRTLILAAPGLASVESDPVAVTGGGGGGGGGAPSASRSTVTAAPDSVPVGGSSTISVTVLDANGTAVAGASVDLSVSGLAATLTQPSSPTDANGMTQGSLTSTTPGTATVTATVHGSVTLDQTAQVSFTQASTAAMANAGGNAQTAAAGSSLGSPLQVLLLDGAGRPVAGVVVSWSVAGGGGSIAASSTSGSSGIARATPTLGSATRLQVFQASASGAANGLVFMATADPGAPDPGPPGPAQADFSTADVPQGQAGAPTSITVQARDGNGTPVTAGGDTVEVRVSGANPTATLVATDNGDGSYTARYTPGSSGIDLVAVRLGGVDVSGSPYVSVVQ